MRDYVPGSSKWSRLSPWVSFLGLKVSSIWGNQKVTLKKPVVESCVFALQNWPTFPRDWLPTDSRVETRSEDDLCGRLCRGPITAEKVGWTAYQLVQDFEGFFHHHYCDSNTPLPYPCWPWRCQSNPSVLSCLAHPNTFWACARCKPGATTCVASIVGIPGSYSGAGVQHATITSLPKCLNIMKISMRCCVYAILL